MNLHTGSVFKAGGIAAIAAILLGLITGVIGVIPV
jgi:hypothetical protein